MSKETTFAATLRGLTIALAALVVLLPLSSFASDGFPAQELETRLKEALEIKREEAGQFDRINLENLAVNTNANRQPITHNGTLRLMRVNITGDGRFEANIWSEPQETIFTASGRFQEVIDVPIPVRDIAPGEIIAEHDLSWQSYPKSRIRRSQITDMRELIGKEAARRIQEDRLISARDVQAPRLVIKGQQATVTFRHPYMELSTTGQVLEDGAAGDTVRVRNINSSSVVTATVMADGNLVIQSAESAGSSAPAAILAAPASISQPKISTAEEAAPAPIKPAINKEAFIHSIPETLPARSSSKRIGEDA